MADAPSRLIAVVTTVGSAEAARQLSRALVEAGLAACAQVEAIESCYVWEGALHVEPEWRVLFKTLRDRYAEVEAAIRERHGYALPAIHAVALDPVHAPYAEWVEAQVRRR